MAAVYRALYRKWRPKTFADVTGQDAITQALSRQIETGRIGHAYLFTGTRGTGKTTCAKVFAKTVNCEDLTGAKPCGNCDVCMGIEDGSLLDVVEIDAASNNGVDDVRGLRDETAYRPSRCRYKVYIIDEVHMLSTAAFNALLKILEEPPSHVIFILATTEIHKVPATILSRCQRFDFTRIPAGLIAQRLEYVSGQEGIELTEEAARRIAALADGAMRDALSLLDTCAGLGETVDDDLVRRMAGVSDKGYLFTLSDAAHRQDLHEVLAMVAALREKSIDVKRLTEELVAHYRNLLLAHAKPDGSLLENLPPDEQERVLQQKNTIGEGEALTAVRRLAEALDRMGRSPDPRVELELALFDIAMPGRTAPQKVAPVVVKAAAPVQAPVQASPPPQKPQPQPEAPVAAAPQPEPAAIVQPQEPDDAPPFDVPEPAGEKAVPAPTQAEPVPTPEAELQTDAEKVPEAEPQAADAPVAPAAKPAPPPLDPMEGTQPFEGWQEVIDRARKDEIMLYSYLKNTRAYHDARRVYIDGGPVFLEFMKENKNVNETIKNLIQEVSGKRYGIGPYKKDEAAPLTNKTQETLEEWKAKGVPVQYENG